MLPTLTASIALDPRAREGYADDAVRLVSAHASATSMQLCFAAKPEGAPRVPQDSLSQQQVLPAPSSSQLLLGSNTLDRRWALVLAGGSGVRLAALTARGTGHPVPKQYCSLAGGRSLLGDALARAERLVPAEQRVVVVAREHEDQWRRALAGFDARRIVVQPRNRGTVAGVLLPLLSIAERDPAALVTILPSDHFVADEDVLASALSTAQEAAGLLPTRVVLVGIEPDDAAPDYGWILPGARHGLLRPVRRFVEKPDPVTAAALLRGGAVWNSFLMVGTADAFVRLIAASLPELVTAFESLRPHADQQCADRLYDSLADADFSRDVLQGSEDRLVLLTAPRCGWTDLGTPTRVTACARWLESHRGTRCEPESLGAAAAAAIELGGV